ncbi:MAG: hypothetical protein SPF30_07725 [Arcanobacterium sp.]|nr:hypothetical protein [Arcanobacterium sp.]
MDSSKYCSGRPDLRRYRQIEPGVLFELRMGWRRVLLSDYDWWHCVLNNSLAK